ncbi:hypothetical protein [Ornithinimicrobium pekingense]|uniref:Uncharacterized protein n=1 Tax=Ornithinimicrobium pekingense TaxID=384677 RepID=A0ABQ2F8Q0_9MICO|nr:hypothetical protein [Ornithinimicrobium pekingense]GGK72779.1 hypothetical protein GCM10011509_21660 [Ornithinimicrobium pekingense]
MGLADVFQRRSDGSSEPPTPVPPPVRPSVAEQFATLSRLGLEPQDGVTATDVSADREAAILLKRHPYTAALHCLARDPGGGFTSHPRVTTVDLEHVVGPDSYPALVRKLADAAGTAHLLGDVVGGVDRERGRWVLRFTFDGVTREIHPRLDHDRADAGVMPEIFDAVAGPGQRAAQVRHGQTISVAYVPSRHEGELQRVLDRWAELA